MADAEAKPLATGTSRYSELDGLRGIAALVVLLYHWTFRFHEIFPGYPALPLQVSWGSVGVELFFMISGFVILMTSRRHAAPGRFALARAIRLYPTFWVCMFLTLAVLVATRTEAMYKSPLEILGNLTMVPTFVGVEAVDGSYWSLNREVVFYVIVVIALAAYARRIPTPFVRRLAVVWPMVGLLCCLLFWVTGTDWALILAVGSMGQYSPLFCIGMLLYLYREGGAWSNWVFPLCASATLTHWIFTRYWLSTLMVAALTLGSVFLIRRGSARFLRWRPLLWLGAISYPLYLLHQNIAYAIFMWVPGSWGPWIPRLLALALVVPLAWAVHEVVEKRASRWLHRRLLRRSTAVASPG